MAYKQTALATRIHIEELFHRTTLVCIKTERYASSLCDMQLCFAPNQRLANLATEKPASRYANSLMIVSFAVLLVVGRYFVIWS